MKHTFKLESLLLNLAIGLFLFVGVISLGSMLTSPSQPPCVALYSMQSTAKQALTDKSFEDEAGMCSKFVRQVALKEYRGKYQYLFGSSAKVSTDLFRRASKAWPASEALAHGGILPGDILFKRDTSGTFGHVGIYLGDNLVAENSSTKYGRIQGAKGIRTLAQYGRFDYIGRLPGNSDAPLILALTRGKREIYLRVPGAELRGGAWTIDRDVVAQTLGKKAKVERVLLRDALAKLKFKIVKTADRRRDARYPSYYVFLKAA